ncbi:MAG: hypothetical protein HYZ01_02235 [Ignavibacteriales bacterium]|nr:hypothetical protein [Ignavibacteriales bacterium]
MRVVRCVAVGFMVVWPAAVSSYAQIPASITVETRSVGGEVPENFIGLSFEVEKVLPDPRGEYFFSPNNKPLIAMFRTLGIRSLRVGGNTADRSSVPVPGERDIDALFSFAKVAGVKVIYTHRLHGGDPKRAAEISQYIMDHYESELSCFAIGNEPNVFAQEYPGYLAEWRKYVDSIISPGHAPGASFCGPGATPGKVSWSGDFARDVRESGRIRFITQHAYPGGSGRRVLSARSARDSMLSQSWVASYGAFFEQFVPTARELGIPYRLEETNSFFHGGADGASNSFASALWGLDFMHWWASHGAAGLNFHTGDSVAAGDANAPCHYAVFTTVVEGFSIRPLGYALKAFDLGGRGKIVPIRVSSTAQDLNLTAYGVMTKDGALTVTIINKEHGIEGHEVDMTVKLDRSFIKGEALFLTVSNQDVAATIGVTLGGFPIREDATWQERWGPLSLDSEKKSFVVKIPAATAAVVRLHPLD